MSSRTEISTLRKFGLIRYLTDKIELKNPSTLKSVGDDTAVLDYTDKQVLVTTDLLLEGIHFDLMYVPLRHLGYKPTVIDFSNIYAMNGHPKQIMISLGISKRFYVEGLEEFCEGIKFACGIYGVDLVGGDVSAPRTELAISIICLDEGEKGKVAYRNGARKTNLICVSGDLRAAHMGFQLLERKKSIFNGEKDFTSDFSGEECLSERQLKPETRKDIVEVLDQAGIVPTSMVDISDSLFSELLHISEEGNVDYRVYEDRTSIDHQTAAMAERFNMNLITAALNGGEGYELLLTVPLADHDKVSEIKDIEVVSHMIKPELGSYFVGRDGGKVELKAQG